MEDMIISMGISVILATIKNASKRKALKAALLKVRNKINEAFSGDPDFD